MVDNPSAQGVVTGSHTVLSEPRQDPSQSPAVMFGIGRASQKPRMTPRERALLAFALAGIEGASMQRGAAHLRLVHSGPWPRRIEVRISATDGRSPIGRTRPLRLTERDFERLIEAAERLEARR
jgi:hypothetical protein